MIPRERVIEICRTIAWNILCSEKPLAFSTRELEDRAKEIQNDYAFLGLREFQAKYVEHCHARTSLMSAAARAEEHKREGLSITDRRQP